MSFLDKTILTSLNEHAKQLQDALGTDLITYYGPIDFAFLTYFREFIEDYVDKLERSEHSNKSSVLSIVLYTNGGSVEAVEKMAEIVRHHYNSVHFIVPEMAMSAGTIWCMSGDKIYMDYTSSLGPIDPQVQSKDGSWVPALGYLDQYERLINKSAQNTLTPAEFGLLNTFDLGVLSRYEQARDLSVTLLKDWLVKYKFKDWTVHRTDPEKTGQSVTDEEKKQRAEEIAESLGDNGLWHSHGRMISISTLKSKLRLEIDDYTDDKELRRLIINYYDLVSGYMQNRNNIPILLHHGLQTF